MTSLQPLGHRVLVQPDEQSDETDSGLILPQDRHHVPVSGTVVALGPGGHQMRYRARQRAIRDCLEVIESVIRTVGSQTAILFAREEVAGLLSSSDPDREVHVGDRVAFPDDAGLKVNHDGVEYITLNEEDITLVIRDAEVAA